MATVRHQRERGWEVEGDEMTNTFIARLVLAIEKYRPEGATGVYVTSQGITWSKRTNPRKFPENFVSFEDREEVTR